MNKQILAVVAALGAFAVVAADAKTPAEVAADRAKREAATYRMTGGAVRRPDAGKERVVFVDCQQKADAEIIRKSASRLEGQLHFPIDYERGTFNLAAPKRVGEATLFVTDDPALPTSLVALEDRWAMVNVAKLAADDAAVTRARLEKELSRIFATLCGGCLSQFQKTLMECVTEPKQLDEYPDWNLPFDTLQKIGKYINGFGIKPYPPATYYDACCEGWAAKPKDAVQQKIWDDVHAIPDQPIKIQKKK